MCGCSNKRPKRRRSAFRWWSPKQHRRSTRGVAGYSGRSRTACGVRAWRGWRAGRSERAIARPRHPTRSRDQSHVVAPRVGGSGVAAESSRRPLPEDVFLWAFPSQKREASGLPLVFPRSSCGGMLGEVCRKWQRAVKCQISCTLPPVFLLSIDVNVIRSAAKCSVTLPVGPLRFLRTYTSVCCGLAQSSL